jgi:signal transduction histidine kinase
MVEIAGEELGASHPIGDELILGRIPEIGVAIASPGVSRRHARIFKTSADAYAIEDMGSRNGTLVNGVPVLRQQPLNVGDRVQLGADVVFLFTRDDPVDEHLSHLRRMEVVGRLTASVVHDFNNLLAVMLSTLEHLDALNLDDHVPDEEAEASIEDALAAARDAAALTRRLLAVARPAGALKTKVSLSPVVDGVVRMCRRMFGDNIRIDQVLPQKLDVLGDETELAQVLMNLCVNARDAMPDGGTLRVSAAPLDLASHAPPIPLTADYAVLTVEDDGVGMPPKVRERIFDPFFTTKEEGRGSGLGLSTVFTAVRRLGGHVEVESEPGEGTKFTLYLPLASSRPVRDTAGMSRRLKLDPETGRAKPLNVLVIAEEALARRSVKRIGRRAGQETRAFDENEALEILRAKILTPDVILIDADSSAGDPCDTIDRVRSAALDVPLVVLTAYLSPDKEAAVYEQGVSVVVRKPVGASDLESALLAALVSG